jgi:antibiotic biosynthesis monooxygenase (ABM) superfamily enzyme
MGDYQRSWKRYKFWRNLAILAWMGLVPMILGGSILLKRVLNVPALFRIVLIAWFLLIISTTAETGYFRCPRCAKFFSARIGGVWWYKLGIFARQCVHCGLKKYSDR